jgi:hypothetical protein
VTEINLNDDELEHILVCHLEKIILVALDYLRKINNFGFRWIELEQPLI